MARLGQADYNAGSGVRHGRRRRLRDLADRMRRATALASDGIVNGMNRACDQCRQHDLERMGRVLRLAKMEHSLGLTQRASTWSAWKNASFYKLKIEAEITATASSGTFRTKTKSEPKLSLANDSGEKYGESFTGSGRWYIEELEPIETKCPTTTARAVGYRQNPDGFGGFVQGAHGHSADRGAVRCL